MQNKYSTTPAILSCRLLRHLFSIKKKEAGPCSYCSHSCCMEEGEELLTEACVYAEAAAIDMNPKMRVVKWRI